MSVQVDPVSVGMQLEQAQHQHSMASPAADVDMLQQQQQLPSSPHEEDDSSGDVPQALNVCCNGNFGVYMLAKRGVQCMCAACQQERAAEPSAAPWIMSPTEFERHSGLPAAKKWRMR